MIQSELGKMFRFSGFRRIFSMRNYPYRMEKIAWLGLY